MTVCLTETSSVKTICPEGFALGNLAHLYANEPREQQLGPAGKQGFLLNARGLKLASYFWPAPAAKAVVHFVHGHGAYLLHELLNSEAAGSPPRYAGSWVEKLNNAGYSVCGVDQQGLGFSEGLRCYIDSFDLYVDDIIQFARSLTTTDIPGFAGLPVFVTGCSLGGCISVNAIHRTGDAATDLYRGAVLLAPMLSLEKVSRQGLNWYLSRLAGLVSWLWPTLPAAATPKNNLYPHLQAVWDSDPLCWHAATRARNAYEYIRATERVCSEMETYTFPFICFHGEADTLCDMDGSKQLYVRARSEDKTLRIMPGMWHVLMKEPGNETILHEILQWLDARCPPATKPARS